MTSSREIEWITAERVQLWTDLSYAFDRAIKTPHPHDRERWSIEMIGIADRIKEASDILGGPTDWQQVGWSVWPFYEQVEGVPLPAEAWAWLEDYHSKHDDPMERNAWTLQFKPPGRTTEGADEHGN